MTDIRFDDDMVIDNGDIALVKDADGAKQRIRDRLSTFKGEWFLDLDFGPPYREQILVKNPNIDTIGAILRSEILKSVSGEFTNFSASINNASRSLTLSFTMQTTLGAISDTITI